VFHRSLGAIGLALVALTRVSAQDSDVSRPELQLSIGAFLPRGNMARDLRTAATVGAHARLELMDFARGIVSVGWTPTSATFLSGSNDEVHIWHYDAGIELISSREIGGGATWRPLAGGGLGGRSYDYRARGRETVTCATVYAALGSELQVGGIVYRLEGRGYLSGFPSPVTGHRELRNDFSLAFGLRRL